MDLNTLKSEISEAIRQHKIGQNYRLLESLAEDSLRLPNQLKLYQLQYFWEDELIDDEYVQRLITYRNGALLKHLFDMRFRNQRGGFQPSYASEIIKIKSYNPILSLLSKLAPTLLIDIIKKSQPFLDRDFLESFAFFQDAESVVLKNFYSQIDPLGKEYLNKGEKVKELMERIIPFNSSESLYYIFSIVSNQNDSIYDLNHSLSSVTKLVAQILKNSVIEKEVKKPEKINKELWLLCKQALDAIGKTTRFKTDCIDVFCYDPGFAIDYKSVEKYQTWKMNGFKQTEQWNYYLSKSYLICQEKECLLPPNVEYLQAKLILDDLGLSNYKIKNKGQEFLIEDLVTFFVGLKHIHVWKTNVVTYTVRNEFIKTFIDFFKNKIDANKIPAILDWFTYKKGYFNFGQKLFIQYGDYLILPNMLLQKINCYVPLINFVYRPSLGRKIDKSVAAKQGEILRASLIKRMSKSTCLIDLPLAGDKKGEVDLAFFDGTDILILEMKGSATRVDLKERENLLKTSINKANYQLKKLDKRFKQNPPDYKWLLQKLKVPQGQNPNVYYLIITTSFEWDDLLELDYPKYSYFTLLNLLKNDSHFFPHSRRDYFYPEENLMTIKTLLELLEKNVGWNFLASK